MRISDWSSDVCSSDLVTPTGMHHVLSGVQPQQQPDEREPVRRATLAELIADASVIRRPEQDGPFASLYPDREPGKYAWGMSIDLNACIGARKSVVSGKSVSVRVDLGCSRLIKNNIFCTIT